MKHSLFVVVMMCMLGLPHTGMTAAPDWMLPDAAQEARARKLETEFRCPVCTSQSLGDSDAELSHDLRVRLRSRIKAGDTDDAVRAYMTARYGDSILLKPPVRQNTWALWWGPLIMLIIAAAAAVKYFRQTKRE